MIRFYFVHLSTDAAKILRQHDASSVCRSKSGGTNFYRCLLLRQLHGQLGDEISAGERPQAAYLLRSWVQIPPGAWIFVCCECRVLSGRGLCDELITRPEESHRLWCIVVCDLETSRMGAPYIYDISSLRVKQVISSFLTRSAYKKLAMSSKQLNENYKKASH